MMIHFKFESIYHLYFEQMDFFQILSISRNRAAEPTEKCFFSPVEIISSFFKAFTELFILAVAVFVSGVLDVYCTYARLNF